ncbi:MAG: hypothetical protein KA783_09120 [Chitinophagales bacterium]|jgi:hypothetical protein|nr:hypothetical protein [Sphingobacteriales bacterium]MBP7534599.1 hypothetical protein [Chitinophagales bacterium]
MMEDKKIAQKSLFLGNLYRHRKSFSKLQAFLGFISMLASLSDIKSIPTFQQTP